MRFNKIIYFIGVFIVSLFVLELLLRFIPVEKRIIESITGQGEFNILCVGDSITYGPGCEEKYSFPAILEQKLNNDFKDKKIKVYNLGKPGLESSEAYRNLIKYFELYSPKILTLMIGACNTENFNYFNEDNLINKNFFERNFSKLKIWNILKLFYMDLYGFSYIPKYIVSDQSEIMKKSKNLLFPDLLDYIKEISNNKIMNMERFKDKNKGWDFYFKNNYEKAEDFFARNLNDIENIYGLVLIYGDYSNIDAAIDLIEKTLFKNPEDPVLNAYAGVLYGEKGDFKIAFEYLVKSLSLSPSDVSIVTQFAHVANIAGNYKKALEYIAIAIKLDEKYGPAYNIAGLINESMGNTDKTVDFYLKGITKDPGYYANYRDLAYYYASINDHSTAVNWFEKAIKLNPYDYDSYKGCAISLLDSAENNDYIKSQEYYIKADKFNPFINSIAERFKFDLKRIKMLCVKNNVRLVLINYPQMDNMVMRRFSESENIPYIDLFNEFSARVSLSDNFPNKYFITGKVCTAEGNLLIAEMIYQKLLENKLFSFEDKK